MDKTTLESFEYKSWFKTFDGGHSTAKAIVHATWSHDLGVPAMGFVLSIAGEILYAHHEVLHELVDEVDAAIFATVAAAMHLSRGEWAADEMVVWTSSPELIRAANRADGRLCVEGVQASLHKLLDTVAPGFPVRFELVSEGVSAPARALADSAITFAKVGLL